ncbi:MAG TPA: hypothetical protein VL651_12415 [Bacteroidia bacterium]|nr:hypothetical protein [Bacteroidia bacterium]
MKPQFIAFFFFIFSAFNAYCCDTLFTALKFKSYQTPRVQSLWIDTSSEMFYLNKPDVCVFWSKQKDPAGYCVAVPDGKKWKYWNLNIEPTYLEIDYTWSDVNGKGKPELILFIHDYFGHHSATHSEESKNYFMQIWDVETTTLLLEYEYETYEQYLDVDMGGGTDSLGNPWPPAGDEFYHLDLYRGKLFITDSSRVKIRCFHSESVIDTMKTKPDMWRITDCPPSSGIYVLKNRSWIRTTDTSIPSGKPVTPLPYFTYWEEFFLPKGK